MKRVVLILTIVLAFLIGIFIAPYFNAISFNTNQKPFLTFNGERNSPQDRISREQIYASENKIVLDLKDAYIASFADTNSMDPLLDKGANGIEVKPLSENDISIGDIVAYNDGYNSIIHRVIAKGKDEEGTYFMIKGDNSTISDPDLVRFDQIKYVLIGVLY